uniref:Kinesin motor domain-containing protein n=1 Tax=Podarcis muralis TaxID=64176 RepID=A0A670IG95_PODMU
MLKEEARIIHVQVMCLTFVPGEQHVFYVLTKHSHMIMSLTHLLSKRTCVSPLIMGILEGYATVLAYGETGSGKTYSMGLAYTADKENDLTVRIISRQSSLKVSYLKIYDDDILDLLNSSKPSNSDYCNICSDCQQPEGPCTRQPGVPL